MDISGIVKVQSTLGSLASASKHLGAAANELGKVVVPLAASAVMKLPTMARGTLETAVHGETPEQRRKAALTIGVGALAVIGTSAAIIGHFVSKHRKAKQYRTYKKQIAAAVEREGEIENAVSSAVAIRSAAEIVDATDGTNEDFSFAESAGCFAILAYDPDVEDGNYSVYRDVYVGASKSMLKGVSKHLNGEGNLYVHADMLYKQPLYVAFYPCEEHELFACKEELAGKLGAEESYNKVSTLAELD